MHVGQGMWWVAWNVSGMGGTQSCHEGLYCLAPIEHKQGGGHQQSWEVAAKTSGQEGVVAQKRGWAVGMPCCSMHGTTHTLGLSMSTSTCTSTWCLLKSPMSTGVDFGIVELLVVLTCN